MTQPFTLYVMHTSHTDIGYTHPQVLIERMYLDYFDRALELCRQTAQAPEEHRFKWTCETFWQVHNYVTARPEREAEFLHYVRTGQIEISAAYLHFTDLIDADAYRRSIEQAVAYCQRHQLPLKCAIHSDINGWPWAMADILAEKHIPYFCSHVHIESANDPLGERGSVHYTWKLLFPEGRIRPDAPIRVPQMFWWQGPNGGRVLHWFSEHYHLGNLLGLSGVQGFDTEKSSHFTDVDHMSVDDLYTIAQRELPRYVEQLRAAGYPYDILLVNTSGFYVDNSPPDGRWCEVIARWNAEHTDIHLRTATPGEWFADFQARYPENEERSYPTYEVAWPDYWAHGLGSDTSAISQARRTQSRRADIEAAVQQSGSVEAQALLARGLEQERLSLEHTFNAWSSVYHPAFPLNEVQQLSKKLTFHHSQLFFTEAADQALRTLFPQPQGVQLYTGPASSDKANHTLHFSAGDIPLHPEREVLQDQQGRSHFIQLENADLGRYVAVLAADSSHSAPQALTVTTHSSSIESRSRTTINTKAASELSLENPAWSLRIDPQNGTLVSLRERRNEREWVNPGHPYGFGQLVHEQIIHPWGRAAVSNFSRLIDLGSAAEQLLQEMPRQEVFQRTPFTNFTDLTNERGPVFDEVRLHGEQTAVGQVQIAWRCYHAIPLVEQVIIWNKRWSDLPEAAYITFPFAAPSEKLRFETGGGFFQPGSHDAGGQLPGTCSSYYTIQRAASLASQDDTELLWLPVDAPLVMPNEINFTRWDTSPWTWNGFLASMPVNHYWHTNFASSQRGYLQLRYRFLSSHGFSSREEALKAASPVEALGWRV